MSGEFDDSFRYEDVEGDEEYVTAMYSFELSGAVAMLQAIYETYGVSDLNNALESGGFPIRLVQELDD